VINYGPVYALNGTDEPLNKVFGRKAVPYLLQSWFADYDIDGEARIDFIKTNGFVYLFDSTKERTIALFGVSRGRIDRPRDKARLDYQRKTYRLIDKLKNYSLMFYDVGHGVSHLLGGECDLNLFPQLSRINRGPFQQLERKATDNPGSIYFCYYKYRPNQVPIYKPSFIDQGLWIPGKKPEIKTFNN